jgi:hypothetical protein
MNISSRKHKKEHLLKESIHRSSIPSGIIKSQIKEYTAVFNPRAGSFEG